MLDFIVVGQGIAGSMLSWFLIKEGKRILVIDKLTAKSATRVASGISNPVTGRRFVKSWMVDELLPFANSTYHDLELHLGTTFYKQLPIVRLFDSVKSQNDWSARQGQREYDAYLKNEEVVYLNQSIVKNDFGGFEIAGGTMLNTEIFLTAYRNFLSSNGLLLDESFDYNQLDLSSDGITYKDYKATKIIFCEGAWAQQNPYFKFLPFQPAKGECLIVEMENFLPEKMISSEVFIAHLHDKLYYIGSTHEWNYSDDNPSDSGKTELLANLRAFLTCDFRIVQHYAAIRPTVKDRRPFLGMHPQFLQVGIFNGMGTKGISLAPFFAAHFVDHLIHGKTLMPEVYISRFS